LRYLLRFYEHVSHERVLSGPGLQNIYAFLRDTGRATGSPVIAEQLHSADPAAVISAGALDDSCAPCARALELFVSVYGAAAGNLALKVMATGGVYIGGGIAPQILEKLQSPQLIEAFMAKRRLEPLCAAIPVRVILNPKTALLGAARYAARKRHP
jgi:glucokinase